MRFYDIEIVLLEHLHKLIMNYVFIMP